MCPNEPNDRCPTPGSRDLSCVVRVKMPAAEDHASALSLANAEAARRLGEAMLLSWYDRDRDLEAPAHVSECHQESAVPGYVDYALARGASLRIDFESGRFVFFYRAAEAADAPNLNGRTNERSE